MSSLYILPSTAALIGSYIIYNNITTKNIKVAPESAHKEKPYLSASRIANRNIKERLKDVHVGTVQSHLGTTQGVYKTVTGSYAIY